MQNVMQLESSYHTNTRKRKASVAFDDEFDYLYGIVTTGMFFFLVSFRGPSFYLSFMCTISRAFLYFSIGLVLPHVYSGKDLLFESRLSYQDISDDDTKLHQGGRRLWG
ncbi:hypothetical protein C1645_766958 [Glomus cerebriforme]|uniref:Uncharacterized protein n=1 Tax=Glomus cerebriforme TaxID=658196 RepID=A0A397T663_9GLOM|nr:hypothetical protein C1645_766958 [Glomus cerebriforme]